ncbi:MAG: type IV pilin N-terminal domain-containing protein [Methanoregula sp.]|uniref:type IV pilin N-terminal domain-containing protein n=1 Tax=Methanoregula sp. TaxID=2052170 RepID=UPI003C4157AA
MSYTEKKRENDRAVSPVVGVMLMLVVVIIIAAIVSGFAGGLINSNSKAPQATIQATYSVGAGTLTMYHAGGDELQLQNIYLVVRGIDAENGGYSGTMKRVTLNRSLIFNAAGQAWAMPNGIVQIPVWEPGQTMYSNDTGDMTVMYESLGGQGTSLSSPTVNDIGKSFFLEIDSTDGKLISETNVKVGP